MKRALLLIDLSRDFIELDGALNCGPAGQQIIPYCAALVRQFVREREPVIDARDAHVMEDDEIASGLFPPHNLAGTPGQELIDELSVILQDHQDLWIRIAKKHYNAMFQTELPAVIRRLGVDELHVLGVCTDICVRYTVNGLYEFRTTEYPQLRVVVHQQGVASFDDAGHTTTLRHMPMAFGVDVV